MSEKLNPTDNPQESKTVSECKNAGTEATKEKLEILTKKHAYWRGFMIRLNDALLGRRPPDRPFYKCHHDLEYTKKILISLPNIDVDGSIKYLQSQGGFCDCEVLINCT